MKANHYDVFAESYTADNESNLLNNYYERPAVLDLVGEVEGRHVLDAGCGAGPLIAALHAKGAKVTGFDASAAMIELARQRLGEDATLHVADLSQPLPFTDGAFDDVVASLVLHYLQDWAAPLAELRRVLRPGGRLILSVNHPAELKPALLVNAAGAWIEGEDFQFEPVQSDAVEGVVDDEPCGFGAVPVVEVGRAGQPDPVARTLIVRIEVVDHRLTQEGAVVLAQDGPVSPVVLFTAVA